MAINSNSIETIIGGDERLISPTFKEVFANGIDELEKAIQKEHDINPEVEKGQERSIVITYLGALSMYVFEDRSIPLIQSDRRTIQNGKKITFVQAGSNSYTNRTGEKTVPLYDDKGEPRTDVRQLTIYSDQQGQQLTVALESLQMKNGKPQANTIIGVEFTPLGNSRLSVNFTSTALGEEMISRIRAVIDVHDEKTQKDFMSLLINKQQASMPST